MTPRSATLGSLLIVLTLTLLTGGCNLLRRGDLHDSTEEALVFSEIGFLASENTGLLYRNALTKVKGIDSYIEIIIPYFQEDPGNPGMADTSTPLVPAVGSELAISFDVVAKDAVVLYAGSPVNQGDTFSFHDGANPVTQDFTIEKTDPISGSVDSRTYTISVQKAIHPKVTLIDHPLFDDIPIGPPKAAAAIDVHFEDEQGNTIPAGGAPPLLNDFDDVDDDYLWLADKDGFGESSYDKDIEADFSTWAVNPDNTDHYIVDTRLYGPGDFQVIVPRESIDFNFVDASGYNYSPDDRIFNVIWDPDTIYLADWGIPGASGLNKTEPVPTLTEAITAAAGSSRFEIRVAQGDYDLGNGYSIAQDISIYGGYSRDFSMRWNMENPDIRAAHPSTFHGKPPTGGDIFNMNAVLSYDPMTIINDSSVLDGIVILSRPDTDGGNDWHNFTSALLIRGLSSPIIQNCTFGGGGGVADNISALALNSCDASPTIRDNNIIASQAVSDGDNSGLYIIGGAGTPWIVGNAIRGVRSVGSSSYGIRMVSSRAEIHGNDIQAGQSVTANSVGISAVGTSYLRVTAGLIRSSAAAAGSYGISLEATAGTSHVFNNTIAAGDGDESTGINTVGAAGSVYEIINNSILTGNGGSANRGLFLGVMAPSTLNFINNLVDSAAGDLVGIESDSTFSIVNDAGNSIQFNAFDDGAGVVDMLLDGTAALPESVTLAQDGATNLYANIEKNFSFDLQGRITSGLDANLAYGGGDGVSFTIEPAPTFLQDDRNGDGRSLDFPSCGWSLGAREYNDVQLPTVVHAAEGHLAGGPGSDKYALGTPDFPFETFDKAHAEIRAWPLTGTVKEIHIAEGDFYTGNITLDTDMRILGGYSEDFSSRNYTSRISNLISSTPGMFYIDGVSNTFLFEGFTLQRNAGAGVVTLIQVQNWSTPIIRNNVFKGNNANSGLQALYLRNDSYSEVYDNNFENGTVAGNAIAVMMDGNASGNIHDNTFDMGAPTGGSTFGFFIFGAAHPEIHHNTISGGPLTSSSYLMEIGGNAWPYVHHNTMNGGTSAGGENVGVYFYADTGAQIARFEDNTIFSGTSSTSNATGFWISGNGAEPVLEGNTITSGDSLGSVNWGIRIQNLAAPTVINNQVFTGDSTDVYGIGLVGAGSAVIDNNDVFAGASATLTAGIDVSDTIIPNLPVIRGNTITGGSSSSDVQGIRLSNNNNVSVVDNDVALGTAPKVVGLSVLNNPGMTIDNLSISGGNASLSIYGMDLYNSDGEIKDSDINPNGVNTGINSWGLFFSLCPTIEVSNNMISGGAGDNAVGVEFVNSDDFIFKNNTVSGNQNGITTTDNTTGIFVDSSDMAEIIDNSIFGGRAATTSRGVRVRSSNGVKMVNNLIHGGSRVAGDIRGVSIENGDDEVCLYSNTIYAGRSNGTRSVGVHTFDTASPRVVNNLIITGSGVPMAETYGFWQESGMLPSQFLHNIIIGIGAGAVPYRDNLGGDQENGADLDAYFPAIPADYSVHLVDIDQRPSDYLQRFTSDGGENEFLSDNWRLRAGGGFDAVGGGLDMNGDVFYPYNTDRVGDSRGAWSVGAYEY